MKRASRVLMFFVVLFLQSTSQGAFQFVAWADNRPYDAANEARFIWMLQQMNQIVGTDAAFHVVPGDYDYTTRTSEDIQQFSNIKTWYRAPGNHDTADLGGSHSAVDLPIGNPQAKFIFLNEYICPSSVCSCSAGRVCPHTLAWLKTELRDNNASGFPVFVVGHEPAYPQYRHIGDSLDYYPDDRDAFWAVLGDSAYKVKAYICGHTHYYSSYSLNGATQIDLGNAGNPGESNQTFVVFSVDGDYVDRTVYTTQYNVAAYPPATNPLPDEGATDISTTPVLSWTPGSDAVSHNVYFGPVGSLPTEPYVIDAMESSSCRVSELGYASGLAYNTAYVWKVDEVYDADHVTEGPMWTFTTKEEIAVRSAIGESTVDGALLPGSDIDGTERRDNVYEEITEVLNVPNKNGYGALEHIWRFDNVPIGQHLQFRFEAHRTASDMTDAFVLSYSTDGATYMPLGLSITKTADDDTETIHEFPEADAGVSGTLWVKVKNTDRTKGSGVCDKVLVDCLYFVSSDYSLGNNEVLPVLISGNQWPLADAGADQTFTVATAEEHVSVPLDGSGSSDPDGTITQYEWVCGETTASGQTATMSFGVGIHTVTLTVTDNQGAQATDQVTVTVEGPVASQPPVADAGPDVVVTDAEGDGESVTLDGSNSRDPDGGSISYEWTDEAGTVLGTAATVTQLFALGEHTVTLTVTDDENDQATDSVKVVVQLGGGTMRVADLAPIVNLRGASGQWEALVTVRVVDQAGSPVLGASVSGTWSGDISMSVFGTTGTDGKVTFTTGNMKAGNSVTFTVNDVTHSSLTYDDGGTPSSVTIPKTQ